MRDVDTAAAGGTCPECGHNEKQPALRVVSDGYKPAMMGAIVWLVQNYSTYKPEYLAEHMAEDLLP